MKRNIKGPIEDYYKKKIKEYKLLFKASVDGYKVEDFFNKCEGKRFTVIMILSKGEEFLGGFLIENGTKVEILKKDLI